MALTKAGAARSKDQAERLKLRLEAEGGWKVEVVETLHGPFECRASAIVAPDEERQPGKADE